MADDQQSPPPKVSRYRSQRRAQQDSVTSLDRPALPVSPPHDSPTDDSISRSKSRYRRKNTLDTQTRPPHDALADARRAQQQLSPSDSIQLSPPNGDLRRLRSAENNVLENGQRERLERKYSTKRSAEPLSAGSQSNPLIRTVSSPPDGQLFPPPKPKPVYFDGPPSSDQIKATRSTIYLPKYSDDDEEAGCFGFLRRKKGEATPTTPLAEKKEEFKTPQSKTPATIIAGGGTTPGTDAPVSAVNAGDRRVLIECGKTKTMFPVTPTTTPVDLIKSAETVLSEHINVRSAVLLEYFGTVGVQRPLRRYEHIRDVMNSWDTDKQNSLILVDPGVGSSEVELSIAGVPAVKPEEASWPMAYSQKVGKWDKRTVTIKKDGQITVQKDPSKPQQAENVCHLSDFDIYTPTQEKLRKKIKPPKKYCFAIKSQQKTSMFESTENFVHFFSTADRAVSDEFYRAAQSWRSWYLVNVMGEGKKPKEQPSVALRGKTSSDFQRGHRQEESFSSHYQLGSFQPLMTTESLEKRANGARPNSWRLEGSTLPERQTSTRRKAGPPVSIHTRGQLAEDEPLANLARRNSFRESDDNVGDSLDIVRRNNSTRGTRPRGGTNDLPPAGLSRTRSNRDNSRGGGRDHSVDLARSSSRRSNNGPPQRPLIDLTPQYREPPQHSKKGRGHRPDYVGPGGLVDAATSPDDPLGIPSSVDWRGPQYHHQQQASLSHHPSDSIGGMRRTGSVSRREPRSGGGMHNLNSSVSSRSPDGVYNDAGFTGEGLLAGREAQQGWGGEKRGRGVMDGSHARGPMIDLRENSQFAGGSLLERVERQQGGPGPQPGVFG